MFEQAFRKIDDVLRKETGCPTELDYIEQASWLLFFKYLSAADGETTGTTRKRLSRSKLAHILVPVPPLPEQLRVVKALDPFQSKSVRLARICDQKLAALNELKKSLLHQAFTDQL